MKWNDGVGWIPSWANGRKDGPIDKRGGLITQLRKFCGCLNLWQYATHPLPSNFLKLLGDTKTVNPRFWLRNRKSKTNDKNRRYSKLRKEREIRAPSALTLQNQRCVNDSSIFPRFLFDLKINLPSVRWFVEKDALAISFHHENKKQVRSDNHASELDFLGHFGTTRKTFRRVWSI